MRKQMSNDDSMSSLSSNTQMMQMIGQGGNSNGQVLEFKFPIRKEQLCDEPADPNRFWVQTRKNPTNWQEDQLLREIENVAENLVNGGGSVKCLNILDNDNFDGLYSIIYYLEDMPASVRKEMLDLLNKGLRFLLKSMEREHVLNNDAAFEHRRSLQSGISSSSRGNGAGAPDLNLYRNCLKAYIYLIAWFLQDNSKLKESKENQATKARNRKVPGSTTSTKKNPAN